MIPTLRLPILALGLAVLLATAPAAQRPGPRPDPEENAPQAPRGALAHAVKTRMSASLTLALRLSPQQRKKLDGLLAWQELGAPQSGHSLTSPQALLDMMTPPTIASILGILEPGQTRSFLSLIGPKRRTELFELARQRRAAWTRAVQQTLTLPPKPAAKPPGKARRKGGGRRRGMRGGPGGGPGGAPGSDPRGTPGRFAPFG